MSVGEMRQLTSYDALDFTEDDYYRLIAGELSHLTALTHTIETMSLDCKSLERSAAEERQPQLLYTLLDSAKQRWSLRFHFRV